MKSNANPIENSAQSKSCRNSSRGSNVGQGIISSSAVRGNSRGRRTNSQVNINEQNYIRNMLQNSILSNNDDKIDFLVSEIETANAKISML
jgi:hypothetical protein